MVLGIGVGSAISYQFCYGRHNTLSRKTCFNHPHAKESAPRTAEAWRWRAWKCCRVASGRLPSSARWRSSRREMRSTSLSCASPANRCTYPAEALQPFYCALHCSHIIVHTPCPCTAAISLGESSVNMVQHMGQNMHEQGCAGYAPHFSPKIPPPCTGLSQGLDAPR